MMPPLRLETKSYQSEPAYLFYTHFNVLSPNLATISVTVPQVLFITQLIPNPSANPMPVCLLNKQLNPMLDIR